MISDKKPITMAMTSKTAAVSRLNDTWVFLFHKGIILLEIVERCLESAALHCQEGFLMLRNTGIFESLIDRLNAHAKLGDFSHCK
jgi:hypothetical protein